MDGKPEPKEKRCTQADHRPMIPELRGLGDCLDTSARELRRRYDDVNNDLKMHWR